MFAVLAGAAAAVLPALAAETGVRATRSDEFTPRTVEIRPGDSVTWTNDGGIHNVRFNDGRFTQPPTPRPDNWRVTRTFPDAGTFTYYCEFHSSGQGDGMAGTVVVRADAPAPRDNVAPALTSARMAPSTLCNRRSRSCRSPGARLRFNLGESALITAVIREAGGARRRVGAFSFSARRGRVDRFFSGRGLRPGSYRLFLTAQDAARNRSPAVVVAFGVRRS